MLMDYALYAKGQTIKSSMGNAFMFWIVDQLSSYIKGNV